MKEKKEKRRSGYCTSVYSIVVSASSRVIFLQRVLL